MIDGNPVQSVIAIAKAFVIMTEVENCRQHYDKAEKLFLRAVSIKEKPCPPLVY